MISLEKGMILTPLQKLPCNVGDLGKIIVATGFEWLPKVQKIAQSGHTDGCFIQKFLTQVGSYSYDDTKMKFITENAGYQDPKTSNSIALDYAISIERLDDSDAVFLGGALGNFSLAGFEMVLHRYVSTYIITYYLPSGLFVIVSWISFLIPMDVIPGRMALLVTLFLVLVNIFNTVTTNTPKAEGLTAIEAWMLACILFVFGALIE